jgi:hypothetical protein
MPLASQFGFQFFLFYTLLSATSGSRNRFAEVIVAKKEEPVIHGMYYRIAYQIREAMSIGKNLLGRAIAF